MPVSRGRSSVQNLKKMRHGAIKKAASLFHHSVNLHWSDYSGDSIGVITTVWSQKAPGGTSLPAVCVGVYLTLFAAQECVLHGRLSFLPLQWKTCGVQLLGLCAGKWESWCWRPARPRGGKTLSGTALNCSPPGHIVLGTTTELSFHFYTAQATFTHCCCSTP